MSAGMKALPDRFNPFVLRMRAAAANSNMAAPTTKISTEAISVGGHAGATSQRYSVPNISEAKSVPFAARANTMAHQGVGPSTSVSGKARSPHPTSIGPSSSFEPVRAAQKKKLARVDSANMTASG